MQRWQTPSDTCQICLELWLCSPRSPAQHLCPGEQGAGSWPTFSSQPQEGVWSSAVSTAATASCAPTQEGTLKAACSVMPLEQLSSVAELAGHNPSHAPHHTAGTLSLSLWSDIQFLSRVGGELTG